MLRLGLLVAPFAVSAEEFEPLQKFMELISGVIPILFVIVTIYFFWGVITYVMAGGEEKAVKQGRDHMLWGIIGMAVMFGAWGIARVVGSYFFGAGTGEIVPPGPGSF